MSEKCSCPIRPKMSKKEIQEEILIPRKMCTDVIHHPPFSGRGYLCSTLLKELRRADQEETWRRYQKKTLKRAGYTDEQIEKMPRKRRRTKNNPGSFQAVEVV